MQRGDARASDVDHDLVGADEDAVRARVRDLLAWGAKELDLPPGCLHPCTDDELAAIVAAQQVERLPAAYDEFLRRAGVGGVGSILHDLFPGDDVACDSLLPDPTDGWEGLRQVAASIAEQSAHPIDLAGRVVVRVHRLESFEYLPALDANPGVWSFAGGPPEPTHVSVTAWLEHHLRRAIKRRYPLRDAVFAG